MCEFAFLSLPCPLRFPLTSSRPFSHRRHQASDLPGSGFVRTPGPSSPAFRSFCSLTDASPSLSLDRQDGSPRSQFGPLSLPSLRFYLPLLLPLLTPFLSPSFLSPLPLPSSPSRLAAIHSAVKYSAQAFKNQKNPRIRAWGPSAIGEFAPLPLPLFPSLFPRSALLLSHALTPFRPLPLRAPGLAIVPALPYLFDHRPSASLFSVSFPSFFAR